MSTKPKVITGALREKLKGFDLFAFVPFPRYVGGSQGSITGFVGTVIVWAALLAYIANSAYGFFANPPQIAQISLPLYRGNITFIDMAVTVRVQNQATGTPIDFIDADPTIFVAVARQSYIFNQDQVPRQVAYYQMVPCTVAWGGYLGTRAICPPANATLQVGGVYAYPECSAWQIDIAVCDSPQAALALGVAQCNPNAITILQNARLNLLFRMIDADRGEYLYTAQYYIKSGLRLIYEQEWVLRDVVYHPNFLTTFREQTMTTMRLLSEKLEIVQPDFSAPLRATPYLSIFGRLSPVMEQQTRLSSTLFDMIGSWFAFFGAISSPLAFFFYQYNVTKFFKKNPKWDHINGAFQHEEDVELSDVGVLHEIKRKLGERTNGAGESSRRLLTEEERQAAAHDEARSAELSAVTHGTTVDT